MAKLKDIASRHNVNITFEKEVIPSSDLEADISKPIGKIRRPWLVENQEHPIHKETGFKPSLNPVLTDPINPVASLFKPGFNQVDKQGLDSKPKRSLNKVNDLRGNPLKVMKCLIVFLSQEELYVTEKLSTTDIANSAKITKESVKTALKNLKKFGLISCLDSYTGVHGWSIYKLKKEMVDDFSKQGLNTVLMGGISSSSTTKIKTTTRIESDDGNFPFSNELENINIDPIADIGFSKSHLMQIASQNKLTSSIIQESINAFAFDLKENNKGKSLKTSPLNYFMGILRNGNPYAPPSNYESEESRTMRIYLERKREIELKHSALEDELLNDSFNDWKKGLTEEEINNLLPEDIKKGQLTGAKTAHLRSYYKKEIWPMKRQEILNMGTLK